MIDAKVYFNGDDCFLVWTMPRVQECWGFAIYRDLKTAGGKQFSGFIPNRTGFEEDDNPPNSKKPSSEWPFQRYTWTDHGVGAGDTISYAISPVIKTDQGLKIDQNATVKVGPVTATEDGDGKASAYFNRGILLSQFMARKLGDHWTKSDLLKLKKQLRGKDDDLRSFLQGPLGSRLLMLLDQARQEKWHVFAALYELDDDKLIGRLKGLGKKAHLVLANGSKKKKGEDGNADAAKILESEVDLNRRMLWSEGLGHNKFVVFATTPSQPFMVWTGSTNWATTGLCTQLNNGILVQDAALAEVYLKQWKLLKDDRRAGRGGANMHFGEALMASNDEPKNGAAGKTGKWTAWFTRTSSGQEMEAVTELINSAREAILFLMFEPGSNGLLQVIQSRLSPAAAERDQNLYIHGVVNTLKPSKAGQDVSVGLISRGEHKGFDLRVIQPEGVAGGLAGWAAEVMRRDFLMGQGGVVGHAIIHSKVIVIDPFTNPAVITGSHNFSQSASAKNDENLFIIKGNLGLAERYTVNIMGVYQHYRWRAYLQDCAAQGVSPWHGLKKSDKWQKRDAPHDAELRFWLRK
jgi:hypothetical protein